MLKVFGFVAIAGALGACAATGPAEDPYQSFNRRNYGFNDGLDRAILETAARGYRAVTVEPVRDGVSNFVSNLGEPVTFTNEVLQGKLPNAAGTVGRFVINSTIGVVGIFNPAGAIGIERTDEDFGQTLGVWGVPAGPYLVMPFLGSTNPRDLVGTGVTITMNPLNYANFEGEDGVRIGSRVLGAFSGRESAIETIENIRSTQVDPYVTVRRFYVRNRAAEIGNLELSPEEIQNVPEYELDF